MRELRLDSRVVTQEGRSVKISWTNIPKFYGVFSDEIFQMAASRAAEKGWDAAILTYIETPFAIFESGYCLLALKSEEMYLQSNSMYDDEGYLCEMDQCGEVYRERQPRAEAEPNPWEYDGLDMIHGAMCGKEPA
jgi:hypothetical protein